MVRRVAISLLSLVFSTAVFAQDNKLGEYQKFNATEWSDRDVVEQNMMAPHVNVIPYSKENDIEKLKYAESPYYISLNGQWSVDMSNSYADPTGEFMSKNFSARSWNQYNVPDFHWRKGGKLVKSAPLKKVSDISASGNATTTYFREFEAPKVWGEYDAYLCVQAKSACYVWINREYVGYCEDSRHLAEFSISKYLRCGKVNDIILQVVGSSTGSLMEMNACPTTNGVTDDVFIYLKSPVSVRDFAIESDYDARSGMGSFVVDLDLYNVSRKGKFYVETELWDPQGKQVEKMGKWVVFNKRSEVSTGVDCAIPQAKAWTAENPNRYTMVVRVLDEDMNVVETVGTRFGFRNVAITDGKLFVNNHPITLRGVIYNNYATDGHLSHERMSADLKLMKKNNVNAIRTAYGSPIDPYFYELCDEYGFYVVCDANINPFSSQKKVITTDEEFSSMFSARVRNMYERYKNHPSIIAWSLGDGRDNGICIVNAYKELKAMDKSRPVFYAGAGYAENTDVIAIQNAGMDQVRQYLSKPQKRPMVMLSYGSSQGNDFGGMEQLWRQVRENGMVQGGFVNCWNPVNFYDQTREAMCTYEGFVTDNGNKPYLSELKGLYRPFNVEFVKQSPDDVEFIITNLLDYSNLDDYRVEYAIYSNLKPRIIEGDVTMALNPGEAKNFKLKVPALTLYAGEELFIRFTMRPRKSTNVLSKFDELGVVEFQLPTKSVLKTNYNILDKTPMTISADTLVDESGSKISKIHVGNDVVKVDFDLLQGGITSYTYRGEQMISSLVDLSFWRQPSANDSVDKNALRMWKSASLDNLRREVLDVSYYNKKDKSAVQVDVMLRYSDMSGAPIFDVKQTYAILHSGDVIFDNEVMTSERVTTLPRIGLTLPITSVFDSVDWFGSREECYSDRYQDAHVGNNRKALAKMAPSYGAKREGGNHSEVRYMALENAHNGLYVDMLDTLFNFSLASDQKHLHVDYKMSGVGAAASGNPLQPENLVKQKTYKFQMHFCGYDPVETAPRDFRQIAYPLVESGLLDMPVLTTDRDRFDAPMHVTMTSNNPKSIIRYTLDGSIPNENSQRYTAPILIDKSTIVKARAFMAGASTSFTAVKRCVYDYVSSATFQNKPNTPYNLNYIYALFDGETGDVGDLSRSWIGFSGNDCVVTLKLSKTIDIDDVCIRFAHVPDAWTFAPQEVKVMVSEDGENFSAPKEGILEIDPTSEDMNAPQLISVTVPVEKDNVRYVRIVAKNIGRVPAWHRAKGLRAWIMTDEIFVNEKVQ